MLDVFAQYRDFCILVGAFTAARKPHLQALRLVSPRATLPLNRGLLGLNWADHTFCMPHGLAQGLAGPGIP